MYDLTSDDKAAPDTLETSTSRMDQKVSKTGSNAQKNFFEEWKSGVNLIWEIKINLENFKKGLLKQQRRLEEKAELQHTKLLKAEQELCFSKRVLKETKYIYRVHNIHIKYT